MQASDCHPYLQDELHREDENRLTAAGVLLIRANGGDFEVLLGLDNTKGDEDNSGPWLKALHGVPIELPQEEQNEKDKDKGKQQAGKEREHKKAKVKKESSYDCAFRQLQEKTGVAFDFSWQSVREHTKVLWMDKDSCCAFYIVDTSAILRAPSVKETIKSSVQKYVQDVQCIHTRTVNNKLTGSENNKKADPDSPDPGKEQATSIENTDQDKGKEIANLVWFDLASWKKLKSADWNTTAENLPDVDVCKPIWNQNQNTLEFKKKVVKASHLLANRLTFMQPFEDYRSKLLNPYNPFAFTMDLLKQKADQLLKSMHDELDKKLMAEWLSGENKTKFSLIDVSKLATLDANNMTGAYVIKLDTTYHFVYDDYSLKLLMTKVDEAIDDI